MDKTLVTKAPEIVRRADKEPSPSSSRSAPVDMRPGSPVDIRPSSIDQLRDYLDCIRLRLERYIAMHGHRLLQEDGTLDDLSVSMKEAHALSRASASFPRQEPFAKLRNWRGSAEVEAELDEFLYDVRRRWSDVEDPHRLAIERIRRLFDLDETQVFLLVAAAAPLISIDMARFYTFAWADFTVKQPTVGFLAELMADTPDQSLRLAQELTSDAPLVRHRLVIVSDNPRWASESALIHRTVTVSEQIVAYLVGRPCTLPAGLVNLCHIFDATRAPAIEQLVTPARVVDAINSALTRPTCDNRDETSEATRATDVSDDRGTRLMLIGQPGSGRRTILSAILARMAEPGLLSLDLAQLPDDREQFESLLSTACTEALMRDCTLLLQGDHFFDDPERLGRLSAPLERVLERFRGRLSLTANRANPMVHQLVGDLIEVAVPAPDSSEQLAMWQRALEASGARFDDALPELLVQRFEQTPGVIRRSVDRAMRRAALMGTRRSDGPEGAASDAVELTLDDLTSAVRHLSGARSLGSIAEPLTTNLSWDDAILDPQVEQVLQEILWHAQHRAKILDEWGFRRTMSYGRGLSCLFYGASGTGKTMMAGVLARTLRKELYRIDLSRIASKWVGETERNLARLFDEAERAQVILLFDEADSLFTRRMQVSSSTDRSANNQIGYLLQRMESYDGMTVMTTNLEKSIDEAFKRRIRYAVRFPMPNGAQRAKLWASMLPERAPRDPDIDFTALGERFEFSGGNIKNAVLRAAVFAAHENKPISFQHLCDAGSNQARDLGMAVQARDQSRVDPWLPITSS